MVLGSVLINLEARTPHVCKRGRACVKKDRRTVSKDSLLKTCEDQVRTGVRQPCTTSSEDAPQAVADGGKRTSLVSKSTVIVALC